MLWHIFVTAFELLIFNAIIPGGFYRPLYFKRTLYGHCDDMG